MKLGLKNHDGEFPIKYYKKFLEYCNLTEIEFQQICDSGVKNTCGQKNKQWQLVKQVSWMNIWLDWITLNEIIAQKKGLPVDQRIGCLKQYPN